MNDTIEAKTQNHTAKTPIDRALYQNLTKFCPNLPKLQDGDFSVLKSPQSSEIIIGCVKHATLQYPNGIYQIEHPKDGDKATLTIEVSFKEKTATAMTLKVQGKTIEVEDKYFYKLLKDIERSGYKADKNATFERA